MGENKIEIPWSEYKYYKSMVKKQGELQKQLYEYMGYEDEYLITHSSLKKLNRDNLAQMVLEQRNMIRKLIDDLEPSKREEHMRILDELFKQ